jgi:dTDP-4-dehydrorhamnose reductase
MTKRLLIIGGSGQLGGAFADEFRAHNWEVLVPSRTELDIERAGDKIREVVQQINPSVIVNTAWLPFVDCEKDTPRAFAINATGAYALAKAAKSVGAIMVHISTDYVFDGSRAEGFAESDLPKPLSAHGASKLAGEGLVAIGNPQHYILRTSALFGNHAKPLGNFILKMKARADANEITTVVSDQTTVPTYAEDLAPIARKIIEQKIPFGVYHVTNSGSTSWYDYAKRIFKKLGKEELLVSTENTPDPTGLFRPQHGILRGEKLLKNNFPKTPTWEDAFERYWAFLEKR